MKTMNDITEELLQCVVRCLIDMDQIDRVCEIAKVHEFSLMRKDLIITIENCTGRTADEAIRRYKAHECIK